MGGRIPEVDVFRGTAILMMAVFHFAWDLNFLGVAGIELYSGAWGVFQKLTAGLFIFIVGVSLTLSRSMHKRRTGHFAGRGLRIFGYGMIITLASLLFMPEAFVFFGILHFIGVAIIIASPLVRRSWLNLLLGIAAITAGILLENVRLGFPWLLWVWNNHPAHTLDLYPLLPWVGVVLIGIFIGNILYPAGKRRFRADISVKTLRPVRFLGRHALLMYFAHLPVVFVLAYVVSLFAG